MQTLPLDPLIAGSFFLVSAVALGFQTVIGQRRGYAYCGRSERAYRDRGLRRYRFWLIVQWAFVVALASIAAAAYYVVLSGSAH